MPLARTAFRTIGDLPEGEALQLGSITAALGTFLWDSVGRADALARASRHAATGRLSRCSTSCSAPGWQAVADHALTWAPEHATTENAVASATGTRTPWNLRPR